MENTQTKFRCFLCLGWNGFLIYISEISASLKLFANRNSDVGGDDKLIFFFFMWHYTQQVQVKAARTSLTSDNQIKFGDFC